MVNIQIIVLWKYSCTLTKIEYEAGLIKEQSPSELLRFTIHRLRTQLRNNRIYHLLEEQQQLHRQVILPFARATAYHQRQVPNISSKNNLAS
jgi:hypothetical protein